jgi:CheY-like chemotaxis protein
MAINNDVDVLRAFRDLLEDEGYRVTTQIYADRNLGAIVQLAPDLIILDYMWSSDDGGWSLLQMLRMDPRTAPIPIVLCTGAVREVEALKGRLDEMRVRVVLKPFNIDELTATIAAEFDHPQETE